MAWALSFPYTVLKPHLSLTCRPRRAHSLLCGRCHAHYELAHLPKATPTTCTALEPKPTVATPFLVFFRTLPTMVRLHPLDSSTRTNCYDNLHGHTACQTHGGRTRAAGIVVAGGCASGLCLRGNTHGQVVELKQILVFVVGRRPRFQARPRRRSPHREQCG